MYIVLLHNNYANTVFMYILDVIYDKSYTEGIRDRINEAHIISLEPGSPQRDTFFIHTIQGSH